MKKWLQTNHPKLRSNQFTKRHAVAYMDYVFEGNNATKNGKERRAFLSDELKAMLAEHIAGAKPDDYLFADRCWRCGKVPMSSHTDPELFKRL